VVGHPRITIIKEKRRYSILPLHFLPLFIEINLPSCTLLSLFSFLQLSYTSCPLLSHFSFIYSKLPVHFFPSFPTDISHPVNLLSYRPQFLSNSLPIHYRYPPLQIYHLPVFSSLSFPTDIYNFLPTSIPPFLQISLTSPPTFTPPFLQISLTSCPLLSLLSCRYI
jgi:hypothetical protein